MQPVKLTDNAKKQIYNLVRNSSKPILGLKIGVKAGGCSGFSYEVDYAEEIGQFDEVIDFEMENNKIKLIIDSKAVMYLLGTEMDYVEEKFKSGFTFSNPNESSRCGCGESFSI